MLFVEKEGTEALEDLFEQKVIDLFEVQRKSLH